MNELLYWCYWIVGITGFVVLTILFVKYGLKKFPGPGIGYHDPHWNYSYNVTHKYTEPLIPLPEGITQQDLDETTEMPPLGDSRRPKRKLRKNTMRARPGKVKVIGKDGKKDKRIRVRGRQVGN